jgi:transcriptional regulator with XRE-family HTH domain
MREAARRVGISQSYLVSLERGRNPSTGRPPVPSPPILAALARVYDVELATLLDASGLARAKSGHVLLYQTGPGHRSPLEAARCLFAGRVDAWIEFVDPRRADDPAPPPADVVVRERRLLDSTSWETTRVLEGLADVLREASRSNGHRRLGVIFGGSSACLRTVENPPALLESEATWEHEVAASFQAVLGSEPVANVCVYREADIEELAPRLDPLGAVLQLVRGHPNVAVEDATGALTTGPAAIEAILAVARPPGVNSENWRALARAAAVGLARDAAVI